MRERERAREYSWVHLHLLNHQHPTRKYFYHHLCSLACTECITNTYNIEMSKSRAGKQVSASTCDTL